MRLLTSEAHAILSKIHVFLSQKKKLKIAARTMMSIFAGSIIENFLLGEPALTPFKNNNQLILVSTTELHTELITVPNNFLNIL